MKISHKHPLIRYIGCVTTVPDQFTLCDLIRMILTSTIKIVLITIIAVCAVWFLSTLLTLIVLPIIFLFIQPEMLDMGDWFPLMMLSFLLIVFGVTEFSGSRKYELISEGINSYKNKYCATIEVVRD